MRRFGGSISSLSLLLLAGCFYSLAGGGLPPNIHTMAIATFDNQTASPDVTKELYDRMHEELQRKLGVRDAPPERADALVKGVIQTYDADVPVGFNSNPQQALTARRHLAITVEVDIIDQSTGRTLFTKTALRGEADYNERAEADGRKQAIEKLVQQIVDGVQSNW
jgi:Lipopolysaccharide-assembly